MGVRYSDRDFIAKLKYFFIHFQRNGTSSGLLRAKTGIHDISQLGQLLAFNGEEKLNFWKSDECNAIK